MYFNVENYHSPLKRCWHVFDLKKIQYISGPTAIGIGAVQEKLATGLILIIIGFGNTNMKIDGNEIV